MREGKEEDMEVIPLREEEVRESRKLESLGRRDLIFSEIKDISSIFSGLLDSKKSKLRFGGSMKDEKDMEISLYGLRDH